MVDAVAEAYERKRAETGEEGIAVLERIVLLRVIDSLWVEHLTAVDDMRRGIGLRAYSQRDPLNEFKVEAYRMFDELKDTIRHDVTHTIFRVSVAREPVPQAPRRVTEGRLELGAGAMAAGALGADAAAMAPMDGDGNGAGPGQPSQPPQPVRAGPKIGRNDPCYCGSGKKYKRCHGA
jgi:preprotein translocase subunit SecA